ncbi:longitudinals lacking protein, isoforms H/M/V-like isoform X9 [Sitodiplosis mosellana]|uniref:longitudinals lacking protein, isoforms H/M/V-like isoform X9 n=1 Tax=Sitodiplosis mosellana TaxID=263140 RepID=UPI0024443615|nr:longitudinals lacking protein, isoforms H/M/V-like isoform X9 [Sitodiplosis mosellana]XP_055320666.1 longitudinals lacking protein, isoforms H/M/V-like isoform X9 [Sitodiplosis mosellana]XP_055320667.1 longitudinals lacking protein, isoforms H/M/V-like isoform X9 [Sitodiplosis mosellana]XP_055320668.1 longitudinals lacking protein, isoforms H/M/V-like isoform X9 [Sitodiplosis mosellana]XP_055320669.1 longitudinals lacking protein, isoforms H/M/V-like isoform X9 [Sitodiplosis mosellana]XP_05
MDDDQQFCLRWNNHQSTLISVFDTLLENGTLVDCTLAAEGKFLKAHKVVLCACSPYFASLLSQQYDKHPIFILKDVKFQELRAMMDYMYRGEVNISQDQLAALLKAAESLQIKGLSDNRSGSSAKGGDSAQQQQQQKQQVPVSGGAAGSAAKTGLTIEQNNKRPNAELPGDREGSTSPLSRKRKRVRRRSVDTNNAATTIDNHDQMSNSSSQSATQQAQPITSTPLTLSQITTATSAANVLNVTKKTDNHSNDDDDDDDEEEEEEEPTIVRHKTRNTDGSNKDKIETELLIEPKSEYEDGNDEAVEDLTMADEDLMDDMEQAGPSHGGEGSSQGYAQWQVDRSQDDVYLATQESVGQHRDAQGWSKKSKMTPPTPPPPLPTQPHPQRPPSPKSRTIRSSISLTVKPMAQLVKDYNFGFPLKNVQQLDAIEQNILTDDKYATSLIGFLKSKQNGTLRQNFPKLFTDDFIDTFNWDGIGRNKFAIRHRVFISHILYEVYKDEIDGAVTNPDKYGQEVRKAIRLSRLRVIRGRNRQKILSERSKNKQFNYFHYP